MDRLLSQKKQIDSITEFEMNILEFFKNEDHFLPKKILLTNENLNFQIKLFFY